MSIKVPIKKYVMDESLSWEERYKQLEEHHKQEISWYKNILTKAFLLLDRLADNINEIDLEIDEFLEPHKCSTCGLITRHKFSCANTQLKLPAKVSNTEET